MSETIELIDSDYIIFMLDDFFLYDFVQQEKIEECLEYFKGNNKIANFTFYPLFIQSKPSKYKNYNIKEKNSSYKVSALIGIWNKKILQKYLKGYKENIWEWETNATERSICLYPKDEFYVVKNNIPKIFSYDPGKYGLFSGKWLYPTIELFKQMGIRMDFSKRGLYNEAYRGLEKSIIASFEMDSGIVPYYGLTHRGSSYIKCNTKCREGKFKQEYKIDGARNIIRWEPAAHWGFGIKNLKIIVEYKDKVKEQIDLQTLFGTFIKKDNIYIINKPNPFILIPTVEEKILSKLIIEGEIIFPLNEEILSESYNKETITNNEKNLKKSMQLWNEFLVSKEKMYHVDFNPEGYTLLENGLEKKIKEENYKIYKNYFINRFSLDQKCLGINWIANKNPGYAIKNPIILLHMKNNKYKIIFKYNIKSEPYKVGNTYYFLSQAKLNIDIPYNNVDKVIIIGKFICPVKAKKLRKIIYGK